MKITQFVTVSNKDLEAAEAIVIKAFGAEIKAGTITKTNSNTWKSVTRGGIFGQLFGELETNNIKPLEVITNKENTNQQQRGNKGATNDIIRKALANFFTINYGGDLSHIVKYYGLERVETKVFENGIAKIEYKLNGETMLIWYEFEKKEKKLVIAEGSCEGLEYKFKYWMSVNYPEVEVSIESTMDSGYFEDGEHIPEKDSFYWDQY